MTERTKESLVSFRHPFALCDVDGIQPPGTYEIATVEVDINSLSFVAFRRISTTITLPAVGSSSARRQFVEIDPADLAAAQQRDAANGTDDRTAPLPM